MTKAERYITEHFGDEGLEIIKSHKETFIRKQLMKHLTKAPIRGFTYREIGKVAGVSAQRVYQIINKK